MSCSKYLLISYLFINGFCQLLHAQTKIQQIVIEYADELEGIQQKGLDIKILRGNVSVRQDSILLNCDSAYLNQSLNTMKAYGNVHINQANTVQTFSDSASYNGNTRIAVLYDSVLLTDHETSLKTNLLTYDMNTRIGTYINGGTVEDGESVLTSELGYYYANTDDAYFRKQVKLVHPKYQLEADTLRYNTAEDKAYFLGPTIIFNEKSKVYCEKGYYESVSGIAVFHQNAYLENPPQFLKADSIFYNRETGIGKAYYNVVFTDTSKNILQYSNYGIYNENTNTITSTGGAIAAYVIDEDTLFIGGEIIEAVQDSLERKTMKVYPYVKIYKHDLQGECDSLYYSDADSTIRMYGSPQLWSDSSQFSSDTLFMMMKNKGLDKIEMHSNGFIINYVDSNIYNQLKGRTIFGYFKNDTLYKIHAIGNGESIYFGQDNKKAFVGINYVQCSEIVIKVKENKFSKVSFLYQPVAKFTPMQQASPETFFLKDLHWNYDLRPLSKEDLLKPPAPQSEEENSKPIETKSSQKEG